MKTRILFVGILICGWMSVHAQIRSSFETILLVTDKKSYLYTDTMYVSGMLVAADVIMPSGLSNYCVVDVIDDKGKVVALKKVRLKDSFLNCRIPLSKTSKSTYFLVRAYTEFMRNFPETTWPKTVVGVNNKDQIPEIVGDSLLYAVEKETKSKTLSYSTDKQEYFPNETIRLTVSNSGNDTYLMMRIERENERPSSLLRGAIRRLRALDKESFDRITQGQFTLHYVPEQMMTIGGSVKTEQGKTFKKGGKIVAFSHQTGAIYEYDIDTNGNFLFAIDDFMEGDVYFLQAYNKKGKSYFYDIDILEETFPGISLPAIRWKDRLQTVWNDLSTMKLDTTRMHWIPEVQVEARLKKDDFYTPKFYKINYLERDDLQKRNYVTFEQIIDAMAGVNIGYDALNNKVVCPTRGSSTFKGDDYVRFKVDGAWLHSHTVDVLEASVNIHDIATVEYIPGSRAYGIHGPQAFNGVILIKTRDGHEKEHIRSRGVRYQPLGLSDNRSFAENIPLKNLKIVQNGKDTLSFIAPNYAGDYKIIVEGIGNRKVIYEEIEIKVIP